MPIKSVSQRDIIGGRLFCKNYTRICHIIQRGLYQGLVGTFIFTPQRLTDIALRCAVLLAAKSFRVRNN